MTFANYGALGLITYYLMKRVEKLERKFEKVSEEKEQVIRSNTVALTKIYDLIMSHGDGIDE